MQQKGITFRNDGVDVVLPYLARIETNSLSVSDKNSVYDKIAGSVEIKDMSEAVAVLVEFARPGFLARSVTERLYSAVEAMYAETIRKNSSVPLDSEILSRLCAKCIKNKIGYGRSTLRDHSGKVLGEVSDADLDLLIQTYTKMRFLKPQQKVRGNK